MTAIRCQICGLEGDHRRHPAREMMFGLRDPFTYLECAHCGCVQLLDPPADMARYYPSHYYSFQRHGRIKNFLRRQWSAFGLGRPNPLGWLITLYFGPNSAMRSVRLAAVPKSARILDVGCGSGHLILDLWHLGYRHVSGADPYIDSDRVYAGGPTVLKRSLADLTGEFDVIMLHHSFEHMDRPADVMRHLARLLTAGGTVILRIPIAGSYAWRHYGVNWVNLDAPRHLFLHTPKSIELLAAQAGLAVTQVRFEGDEGQFWGSEQYQQDIPLTDPRSCASNSPKAVLTRMLSREFKAKSDELNRRQEGDLACFHLLKAA